MSTPTRLSTAAPALPATPLARRVAPDVKLLLNICLRCAKDFHPGAGPCNCTATRKCGRCQRLKKSCDRIPQGSVPGFNHLVRMATRIAADENDTRGEAATFPTELRTWTKEVEAYLRKEVKQGGTHRPQGDEIALLQVKATNRLAEAVEGILDVLRSQHGHLPLGALDAQTDAGSPSSDPVGPQSPTILPASNTRSKRRRAAAPPASRKRNRKGRLVREDEEEEEAMEEEEEFLMSGALPVESGADQEEEDDDVDDIV